MFTIKLARTHHYHAYYGTFPTRAAANEALARVSISAIALDTDPELTIVSVPDGVTPKPLPADRMIP